jgi:hypothetical protein
LIIKYLKTQIRIACKQLQGILIVRYLTSGECITDENLSKKLKGLELGPLTKNGEEYFMEEYINEFSEFQPKHNRLIISDYRFSKSFNVVSGIISNLSSEKIENGYDPIKFLNLDMRREISNLSDSYLDESDLNEGINQILDSLAGRNSLLNILIDFISISGNCVMDLNSDEFTPEKKEYLFNIIPILHKLILYKYLIIFKILKKDQPDENTLYQKIFHQGSGQDEEFIMNIYIDKLIKNVFSYNDDTMEFIKSIKNNMEEMMIN